MEDTKKLIEKYKRELMELSRNAPSSTEQEGRRPLEEEPPVKAPKVIGYVTEDSGDFPSRFDKLIAEAVENDEVEKVRPDPPEATAEIEADADGVPDEPPSNSHENSGRPNPEDNMAQGTGKGISDFPVPEYSDLDEFESSNAHGGTLEFQVFAAREALPIENALIVVTTRINGKPSEMFSVTTDNSGETGARILPAPSKSLSQDADNDIQPFALYDATVEKKGYAKVILRDIPIFDGVQSIQRVAMIPEIDFTTAIDPDEEITEVRDADE